MSKEPGENHWLLTGWENKETATNAAGEVHDSSDATTVTPTRTRRNGDVTVSNDSIRDSSENSNPQNGRGSVEVPGADPRRELARLQREYRAATERADPDYDFNDNAGIRQQIREAMPQVTERQNNTQTGGKATIAPTFSNDFQKWIEDGKPDRKRLYIGTTSAALQSIGVDSKDIFWDTSKINKIQRDHAEMSDAVLYQVPDTLERPVVVMNSETQANRITMLGEVYADNRLPVMAVMELLPTQYGKYELNSLKIANAYTKDSNGSTDDIGPTQNLIDNSEILYVDPDKNRTAGWLSRNQLQLPFGDNQYGSIGRVTLIHRNVNGNYSADSQEQDMPEWKKKQQGFKPGSASVNVDLSQYDKSADKKNEVSEHVAAGDSRLDLAFDTSSNGSIRDSAENSNPQNGRGSVEVPGADPRRELARLQREYRDATERADPDYDYEGQYARIKELQRQAEAGETAPSSAPDGAPSPQGEGYPDSHPERGEIGKRKKEYKAKCLERISPSQAFIFTHPAYSRRR